MTVFNLDSMLYYSHFSLLPCSIMSKHELSDARPPLPPASSTNSSCATPTVPALMYDKELSLDANGNAEGEPPEFPEGSARGWLTVMGG